MTTERPDSATPPLTIADQVVQAGDLLREALNLAATVSLQVTQWVASTATQAGLQLPAPPFDPDLASRVISTLSAQLQSATGQGGRTARADGASEGGAREERQHDGPATTGTLRQRGNELLDRSASVGDTEEVHPAYARILGELAPDEARMLRFLAINGPQPSIDVRTSRPLGVGSEKVAEGLSMIAQLSGCRHIERSSAYFNNLYRLGLVWFSKESVASDRYQVIEVQPEVIAATRQAGHAAKIVRRSIQLTSFGTDFWHTCFSLTVNGRQKGSSGGEGGI